MIGQCGLQKRNNVLLEEIADFRVIWYPRESENLEKIMIVFDFETSGHSKTLKKHLISCILNLRAPET